jgi:hypothetical protein
MGNICRRQRHPKEATVVRKNGKQEFSVTGSVDVKFPTNADDCDVRSEETGIDSEAENVVATVVKEGAGELAVEVGVCAMLCSIAAAVDMTATAGLATATTAAVLLVVRKLEKVRQTRKRFAWFWLGQAEKDEVRRRQQGVARVR